MTDKCPHCEKELHVGLEVMAKEQARTALGLKPEAGCLLTAKTIAGTITNFAGMLDATAKSMGETEYEHFIERIDTSEDGEIKITFLMAKKRNKKKQKQEAFL